MTNELTKVLKSMELELVDVEFTGSPSGKVLRVFIDKPGGVDLNTCSGASEKISDRLDELDMITAAYNLEVSSPGLDRPLKGAKDFKRFVGSKVAVKTVEPVVTTGRRKYTGKLLEANETGFVVEVEGEKQRFEYDDISVARLVF